MAHQAQLKDGIAVAVTESADPLSGPEFVALDAMNTTVLGKRWTGSAWADAVPDPADPAPAVIDRAALIDLCQTFGGMTDAMLVSAHGDPLLAAFWIKLDAASAILPSDQRTLDGLAAVAALGYLPEGVEAVIAAWPAA